MKYNVAFLAAVACFVLLASECIRSNPVLVDEFAHVPAGVSYWDLGRHYLYRENPPVVRLLTALPVWLSNPKTDYSRASASYRSEWGVGVDFIAANGPRHHTLYGLARRVVLFLSVGCALTIFVWAGERYGKGPAFVAAALWLADPTVLAFSSVATVDVGAAAFGCLATYLFWRFLREPVWFKAVLAGVGLGLAEGCKFSMLALYPAWLLSALLMRTFASGPGCVPGFSSKPAWGKVCAIFVLSILVLNMTYGFDRVVKPLGSFQFKSRLLTGLTTVDPDDPPSGNVFRRTWFGSLPSPFPEDYLRGFDSQKWDEEFGFYRLSHGRLVFRGSWSSPLVTLAYKLPLGTIALLVGSALFWVVRSRRLRPAECVAAVTGFAVIALLCTQTGLNWVARYTLPALPFVFFCVGRPVEAALNHRLLKWAVAACLLWNAASVMSTRPHFISFANELVGGPDGARDELAGSNFDWGQDLFRLQQWAVEHPGREPLVLLYYGALNPDLLSHKPAKVPDRFLDTGVDTPSPPGPGKPFYLAISKNLLHGVPCDLPLESGRFVSAAVNSPFLKYKNAVDRVGHTIYIFRVVPTAAEVDSPKAITYDQLRSSFREVTAHERRIMTFI